jgi:acetylornithine deacetylase/succinyl-diaminopimelate desuccinylase-like protein
MAQVYSYVDEHADEFVERLIRLVRQPSVSATGEGIQKCSEMVEATLQEVGLSTRILRGEGNPVVIGEIKSPSSSKTLLFYDHYDVQPPEPLEEWEFDAFSGKVHEGRIYGRGVSDNKGNIVSRVAAVQALLNVCGETPVNVKFVIEGEEEIGGRHLERAIRQHGDLFKNDATIWEFGATTHQGRPQIYLGLKGVLSVELTARGASRDVHSANAPLVINPAWRLVWALNGLKNQNDEVLIEEFYDSVEKPSEAEIRLLRDIPLEEAEMKKSLGLRAFLRGRRGIEAKKALLYSPTCTINGFLTGYTGQGSKTVLPNKAVAKLDFRLVPRQMPDEIFKKLVEHLQKNGFSDVEAVNQGSTEPTKTPLTEGFVRTVVGAAEKVYRKRAVVYPTSAASGPMHLFRNLLGVPVVSAGCSHADARGHAPNENLTIEGFTRGIKFMATILEDFSCTRVTNN